MKWSQEQLQAIGEDSKNILVSAAAGSGKTAVLVERVVSHLLRDPATEQNAWDIDKILVVTFTKAAAEEMKQRIKKRLQEAILTAIEEKKAGKKIVRRLERQLILLSGASISTIDSFCQSVIKNNFNAIDLDPKFRVANENELEILKLDILDEMFEAKYTHEDEALTRFAEKYGTDRGDSVLYNIILKLHEKSRNQPFPELWLTELERDYESAGGEFSSLMDTKWWPVLQREIKCRVEPAQKQLAELSHIVENFSDESVREKFNVLVEFYQQVVNALLKGLDNGWQEIYQALVPMDKQPALPRITKNVEPEVKDAFKEVRDEIKKLLGGLRTEFVLDDEATALEDLKLIGDDVKCIVRMVKDFSEAFAAAKRQRNIVDFSDMEHLALDILIEPSARPGELVPSSVAMELRQHYQEIMVDEYQDTNEVQEAIVSLIAGEDNGNIFTVGDVKQSIYGFRSSEPALFLKKYHDYGMEGALGGELITLGKNFRSRREILSAINYVFAQVMTTEPNEIEYDQRAMLNEGEPYGYGEPTVGKVLDKNVELVIINPRGAEAQAEDSQKNTQPDEDEQSDEFVDDEEATDDLTDFELEAQYIATRLKEIKESGAMVFDKSFSENNGYRPVTWRDMVILLRSTQSKGEIIQEILQQNDIPVYANANEGFFHTREIQLMYSLLSVIDNAQQDIYLAAVLFSPIVGLTATELAQIKSAASSGDMYSALLEVNTPASGMSLEIKEKVDSFLNQLSEWRRLSRQISVPELIWQIFRDTGYYEYVGSLQGGTLRQANLRMLVTRAQEYQNTDYQGLFRFLRFIQRMQAMETDLSMARTLGEGEDVVRVMTIHKSKGLEFPVVVIADMGKKFNEMDLRDEVLVHKKLGLGLNFISPELMVKYPAFPRLAVKAQLRRELKAEELRVLYVAMTRAREKLIMVGRKGGLETAASKWCEFIDSTSKVIPVHALLEVNSYLDWVAMTVARHRDGAPLWECAGTTKNRVAIPCAMGETSRWTVTMKNADSIHGAKQVQAMDNDILSAVRLGEKIEGAAGAEALSEIFSYEYDYRGTREVPAKLTVSELKRQFAAIIQPEDSQQIAEQQREYIFNRPQFVQAEAGKAGLRGNEYGTLMHTVMQQLDLSKKLDSAGIRHQIDRMIAQELITREQAAFINVRSVANFFQSALGQRYIKATERWRELPFSRALDANEYYDNVAGEFIFSQGVIDALFKEDNGNYVLMDYKTDRDTNPDTVKAKYELQIELYTDAIQEILGVKVAERYLVMLHDNSVILL